MTFYSLFVVVLLFCCNAFGNTINRRVIRQTESNSCTTPDNQPGTCINLKNCPSLNDLLKTQRAKDPEIVSFLQKSLCGRDINNTPKVCCNPDSSNPLVIDSRLGPVTSSPITTNGNSQANQIVKDYSVCGRSKRTAIKIVGGQNSTLGDWPWMVAVGYRRGSNPNILWECGGSLISDRWVITAAHCVQGIGSLKLTTVRMGDLHLNDDVNDGASPVDIKVETIIPHPQYSDSLVMNDVALLRLRSPVTFTENIRPICIPSSEQHKGNEFYFEKSPFIAGWGHTQSKGTRSEMLLETQVDIVDVDNCAEIYKSGGFRTAIDIRVLCASRKGKDTCQGDSGGPLMIPSGPAYYLAGIVSYGVGCANEKFPGVYTRVAYFSDWIRSTTGIKL